MKLFMKPVKCGGVIVINEHLDKHTHIKTENTARTFISLLRNRIKPESEYLVESARKILTPKEFSRLRKKRDRYVNVGGRKR